MSINYLELLNCRNPDEAVKMIQEFTSNRSDKEHLIRSLILDIHADIEMKLKQVLYQHMLSILFRDANESENQKRKKSLEKMVTRLGFMDAYRLLKPCLDAFPADEFADIEPINDLRNQATHSASFEGMKYKGRNPFKNPDSLAQLFIDSWAIDKQLSHFYEVMIGDPRALAEHYAKFYKEHRR